jgi:hypothetical protein
LSGARPARRRPRGALLLLLLLAGLGCSGSDDDATGDGDGVSTLSAPEGIALDDSISTTAPPTTRPPQILPDTIVLSGNGVNAYPLGTPQVDLTAMLAPLLGEPEVQPAECPGGSDTAERYPGGLTLYFGGGQLSGWAYTAPPTGTADPATVPVQTDRGITLGDTVAELQAAHDEGFQWIADSTLGTEFYIGSGFPYLGGLASGEAPDAVVEALWGADSCAAR